MDNQYEWIGGRAIPEWNKIAWKRGREGIIDF